MTTIKATGESVTTERSELVEKYFMGFSAYGEGNMGIISLLSDLQHIIGDNEHYRQILNDIKMILITDDKNNG